MKLPEETPALSSNVAGRLKGRNCSSCRVVQVPSSWLSGNQTGSWRGTTACNYHAGYISLCGHGNREAEAQVLRIYWHWKAVPPVYCKQHKLHPTDSYSLNTRAVSWLRRSRIQSWLDRETLEDFEEKPTPLPQGNTEGFWSFREPQN